MEGIRPQKRYLTDYVDGVFVYGRDKPVELVFLATPLVTTAENSDKTVDVAPWKWILVYLYCGVLSDV